MPDMTPVANTVNAPNPQGTLDSFSKLLGIQQQQQALQTGKYTQQTAAATASQAQQRNAELQAVGNLTKNAGQYKKADGSFDNQRFSDDVNSVAPVYGQEIANAATSKAGMIYDNQQKLLNLQSDRRQKVADTFGALAADPSADHARYVRSMQDLVRQYPDDAGLRDLVISVAGSMPNQEGTPLQQWGRNAAIAAKSPTAAQTDPQVSTMQGPNGLQAVNTNPQAVGGVSQVGKPLPQGIGPTDQPGYVAQRAAAGSRATGVAGSDIERANQVSSQIQPSQAAIGTTQRIDDLAEQIRSGKFAAYVSKAAAAAGVNEGTMARQLLEKDLGQVKTMASAGSGTDARMGQILSGFPDATSDTGTIHAAMDYIRGSFRQNVARGDLLNSYRQKHPDLTGFQHADDVLTGQTDPLMHEFMALKTPQDRIAFYRRNFSDPAKAQAFKDRVAGVSHVTGP